MSIVRPWLVDWLGQQAFRAVYSLVAFATLVPLVVVFARHEHAGPMLWYLRGTGPIRWLAWLMMLAALIFLVAGLVNPNPAAIGIRGAPIGTLQRCESQRIAGTCELTRLIELRARIAGELKDAQVNVLNVQLDPATALRMPEIYLARHTSTS